MGNPKKITGLDVVTLIKDTASIPLVQDGKTVRVMGAVLKALMKGDKGDKGDAGTQGPAGVQGIAGPQGNSGAAGAKGDDGEQGVSITGASIEDSHLFLNLSNGSTIDSGELPIKPGTLSHRGPYDASTNLYPATDGSGPAGAIKKGDLFVLSVAGTLGANSAPVNSWLMAEVDDPGQTAADWALLPFSTGLENFEESLADTGVNATTPVVSLTASNAATHVDVAFVPKGNGSILARVPDGTTAGGNKRGIQSIDLSVERVYPEDVASGNYSVLLGAIGKAAGTGAVSVAGGMATDANSIAVGLDTEAQNGSVAIGQYSAGYLFKCVALQSGVVAGNYGLSIFDASSAAADAVAIGYDADAAFGAICLGRSTKNTAGFGISIGFQAGLFGSGNASVLIGYGAYGVRESVAIGACNSETPGDFATGQQYSGHRQKNVIGLLQDGADANGETGWKSTGIVAFTGIAVCSDGTDFAYFKLEGLFDMRASPAVIIDSTITPAYASAGASGWGIAFVAAPPGYADRVTITNSGGAFTCNARIDATVQII